MLGAIYFPGELRKDTHEDLHATDGERVESDRVDPDRPSLDSKASVAE